MPDKEECRALIASRESYRERLLRGEVSPSDRVSGTGLGSSALRTARAQQHKPRTSEAVKVYSMPAIGRMNVHTSAHVGRRRINPMEETAECPDAVGDFAAMAIDRLGCSIVSGVTRRSWTLAGR